MKRYIVQDDSSATLSDYAPLTQTLLINRGIVDDASAEAFVHPDYEKHTHDPFLMKDMDRAVDRINEAVTKHEKIIIYSDYDHDGIPGGAVLFEYFTKIGYKNFENYIPHRHDEGFGLNVAALEKLAEGGAKVVITVDCSITQVDEVARANEHGIDVIITDHHLPTEKLPDAYAILNPKQDDCKYPFKDLCGAGVAYKLLCALVQKSPVTIVPGWEKWALDLVAIATIGDMMPLQGENRVLVHFGLLVIKKTKRPGLHALFKKTRLNRFFITEDDIGFMIVPRINAASRVGSPTEAFNLLTAQTAEEATAHAETIEKLNRQRKTVMATMSKEAKKRLGQMTEIRDVIVMGNPDWPPSVLGLAAMNLSEEYNRPVFLWGRDGQGNIKGSCRAPDGGVRVVDLMEATVDLYFDYGGHNYAGGFAMKQENLHKLEERLVQAFQKLQKGDSAATQVSVDGKLSIDDATWETHAAISVLEPFGIGNEKPLFIFEDVIPQSVDMFGKGKEHLKIIFHKEDGSEVEAIQFFSTEEFSAKFIAGEKISIVAHIEKSMFLNKKSLRLRIEDTLV